MLLQNRNGDHGLPLTSVDADTLSVEAAQEVSRYLTFRSNHQTTPLYSLPGLAQATDVTSIHIKDESKRLGLNSFKALGGSYAVIRLVLEEAGRKLDREVDIGELHSPEVRAVADGMTFGCATDGNHGKSVAAGAQLVGAKSAIFVHAGVSQERVDAISQLGADIYRVEGTYDDSLVEAERKCAEMIWTLVSDTSWPGYERIPTLVMQGYTAMLSEAIGAMSETPTHTFIQAGVGGLAATVAGHFDICYGEDRPRFITVEPNRAACILASAQAGQVIKIGHDEPTIMAMLECYEASQVAWRILARRADAFMTICEHDAAETMRRLAQPLAEDPVIVAGESGAAGLAGFLAAANDLSMRTALGINTDSRIFLINTEGATDTGRYEAIVGSAPDALRPTACALSPQADALGPA